jgi:hypothetical protein
MQYLKKLPVGIQNITEILTERYLYVDKTEQIHQLISKHKACFLSRPRRFGKSLLISTLQAIFTGQRDLFAGLRIAQLDHHWPVHPIIRIDFTGMANHTPAALEQAIHTQLSRISQQYQISTEQNTDIQTRLQQLIATMARQNKVVILIDEYDKPMVDHITQPDIAQANKQILKSFYGVLKSMDESIRFILLTGVTKFSRVSVFSDLNNLYDLTLQPQFADLTGYTQHELENYFAPYLPDLAQAEGLTLTETLDKIREWYNGFQFSRIPVKVYNPFSVLQLFQSQIFANYWFESATPTLLIRLLQARHYPLAELDKKNINSLALSQYDIDDLQIIPLMLQTGYLTIQAYDKDWDDYTVGYPNREVQVAFNQYLVAAFSQIDASAVHHHLRSLIEAITTDQLPQFFTTLKIFFANIPYDIQLNNEKYYQSIFYVILQLIGIHIQAEVRTNQGRIDAVIHTENRIYLFEFKLQGTAAIALEQIRTKQYAQKYGTAKPITLVGAAFDPKTRNLGEFEVAQLC